MNLRSVWIVLFMGLLLGACEPVKHFDLDKPFEINYKQTLSNRANNLKITFEGVTSDSRCPMELHCIWAGNAEVKFTIAKGFKRETFVLNTGQEPFVQKVFGYYIDIEDLMPPASTTNPPQAQDYVATLTISESGNDDGSDDGCRDNSDCTTSENGMNLYCRKPNGLCTNTGQCATRPEICTMDWNPVCGCDGKTYGNECSAAGNGVNVAYKGECNVN